MVEGTICNRFTCPLADVSPSPLVLGLCLQEVLPLEVKITKEGVFISEALLAQLEPLP